MSVEHGEESPKGYLNDIVVCPPSEGREIVQQECMNQAYTCYTSSILLSLGWMQVHTGVLRCVHMVRLYGRTMDTGVRIYRYLCHLLITQGRHSCYSSHL